MDRVLAMTGDAAAERLAAMHEGQWFERKSGRVHARDLAVPMVAMANAEGGYIVMGIHDGQVDGVDPGRVNELRQAAFDFTSPGRARLRLRARDR